MESKIIGYTTGVFDMFHVGHLNILKKAKEKCDYLIVGVSTDEVVLQNKLKKPIICYEDRFEIVKAIKYVDDVVPQVDYSIQGKIDFIENHNVKILFVGSDWKGTDKWNKIEEQLNFIGCKVEYIPHTDGISSTILRDKIND